MQGRDAGLEFGLQVVGRVESQLDLDPDKLIFIDETGASTKMARLRGRAPRGERCRAAIPHGHWKTTTFTAGLRREGLAAPMLLDGPMDGDAFLAYVDKVLVPELNMGQLRYVLRAEYLVAAEGLNKVSAEPFKINEIKAKILEMVS